MHSGPGGGLEPATTGGSAATAAASDERFALNNLDIAASAADGAAKSEARAEAANRVREALRRGSAAAADVAGCSDGVPPPAPLSLHGVVHAFTQVFVFDAIG